MNPAGPALRVFYGGTFDPVHCGHLHIARNARDHLSAAIRLMPAADPPHRAAPGASAEHRARMLDLAVAGERDLLVDRRELLRDTPSYSVDTLRVIRAEYGMQAPVALLIGADSLAGLPQWKDWQRLFDLAHFVVAARPGVDLDRHPSAPLLTMLDGRWTDSVTDLEAAPAGRVLCLPNRLHPGSATGIRERIAAGEPWRELVPAPVAEYIVQHRLYVKRPGSPASL